MHEKQFLFSKNAGAISRIVLLVFLFLFAGTDLWAQRIASVTGNWHDIATWGGAAVPTAAESVTINSGVTVTINATGAECSSLSFASNSVNSALNISGAFTLDVTGDISYSDPSLDGRVQTIAIGTGIVSCANLNFVNTTTATRDNNLTITTGSISVSGTIAMPGATTENGFTCTGNSIINLGGNFTGTGTFTRGTSTLTLNGSGSQSIRGTTYFNIIINKAAGVTTFAGTTSAIGRLTLTSGTLNLDGATTVGSLDGSSTITSDGAANRLLTVGSDNTSTSFSGVIQNGSRVISLTKSGSGTLTLNTANTYTGATTISAGTIQLGAANVLSDISAHTVTGTLDLNGFSETIGSLAGAGTVTSTAAGAILLTTGGNNTATSTFSGLIEDGSGTLSLTKAGTGIMILSGLNSYTGATTVSAGTLTLGSAGNGTNSPLGTIASGTTVNTGAALNLAGFSLSTLEALTLNGTGIASAGALNNTSTTLSSTYTGSITLASASSIVTAAGGLVINTGTITGAGLGLTLGGAGIGTMQSLISTGSGTLTKIGAGIWILTADNEYTGLTTISAGTLRLGTTGNVTNGPLGTVDNGVNITAGALDLNGFTLATAEAITLRGTGISAAGALTNSSATAVDYSGLVTIGAITTIATNAGDLNLTNTGTITGAFALTLGGSGNGSISSIIGTGAGTIVKTGTGSWTLSGASTYTGVTTISVGTLKIGANNVGVSGNSSVTVTSTLDLNGFNATIGSLAGAGTVTSSQAGSVTLTTGGKNVSSTFSGVIENGSGTLNLVKAGTLIFTLSGLSTYTGLTTINTGTIALGEAGDGTNSPLGTTAGGTTVNTGAVLNVNGFTLSTSEPLTLNGTGIAAAGALINGSATLSADYSGLITLESASSIVATTAAVSFNITNTGTITGAGFDLTLGGAGNGTMQSLISTGSGTLTKIGVGIWTLTADNEFTGLTTITAGTLRLGTAGNATNGPLGTVTNGVNITAGALDLNGFTLATAEDITLRGTGISAAGALTNSSATAVDYSGLITIGANTTIATNAGDLNLTNTGTITGSFALTLSGSGNGSISSIIGTGAGTIVKTGTGSWTLSGASTYTGVTTISVGTIKVGASNAGISNSSAVTVTSTLDLNGFNATIGSLAGAGTVTSSQAGSVTLTTGGNNTSTIFSGIIENGSGTLNLTKAGTLIFTVSGLSTFTGLTTINAGTITLGAIGDGTNSPLGTIVGGTTVNTGAVLNVNGFTLSTSEPLTLNGTGIAAAGALINGSATLSADYSGLITLESASSIVATTAAVSFNITNPGTITGSDFGLTLGGAGIGTISSIIGTGAGTLTKIGAGAWTLSSANTFSGGTTLSAGILNINHLQALGAVGGTFTITAGTINNTSGNSITTLNYPMAWNGSFTFTGTNDLNLGTGAVSMNASIIATISANTLTVGGIITGGVFNFTKAGAGILAFGSNDVSVTDLSITAGTLVSTSGTLSLSDDYVNNGIFTPNNGTIAFIGNTAQTIGGTVLDHVFHNFLVNKPLALTMVGGATSLTVNDYTNTTGSFTPPATFNINSNTILTAGILTAGTTINAAGNWTNNGGTFTAGTGTVNFNGTAQAIGGSSNHAFNHFTINPTSTLTASSGIMSIAGNWVNDGAFVHNSGTVTFTRTTPQTLGGANSTTFYDLIENGLAGKTTLLINTSIANNLTITAGTLDIGLFTSNGNGGTFSIANSATAIFLLEGAFPTGFATVTLGAASVITYSGATAQVIYPVAAPGYGYLNITNTAGATAGGNLIVQNTVTISSGAILDASNSGNYDISLGLNWTNNGGTFLQRAGTVTFTGTVAQAINGTDVNQTFHHLQVNKTLALTVPATLNISGDLTLTSGTLTAGTSVFIGGNMTNNGGVFTAGAGTVTFNGSTQAIAGSVPITFHNLTINSGSTLTGPAAMTLSGEWNNSGSFVHNNGQVTFTGTTSAITSTNTTESFYNFILNKTAANVLSTGGSITTLNVHDFTQTLGNFTPPSTFSINGNAVLTAGTFTAGTTTNIGGNWTKATAAIFTPGTNTVNFNGSGAQSINGTSTTQTFYNLIVNKGGSSLLNTGGSTTTLTVNDLTMTLGDFTAPAAFTINGNALLNAGNLTAGTNLTARGDWTNNGGIFSPGTNTLNFTGTGAQSINGTALSQTFYNVIVNKTALTLLSVGGSNTTLTTNNFTQTQGDFTFSNTLHINGFLTLTAGTFTSGTMLYTGGNWTNNSTFVHSNGTVNLDGTLAQAIAGSSATSFNNLTVSNTAAAVSVNTNADIAGTLNMNGTGSLLVPGATIVLNNAGAAGTITGNGTIRITRIAATADYLNQYKFLTNTLSNMTLNFSGAGAQTVNGGLGDIGALTLSGSGAKTLPALALNILGDFTFSGTASATALASISVGANVILGAGTVFTGGAFTHNITGNWTNNGGTFTSTNSTVNFNNTTGPQNINGTAPTQTFFNVLLNNTGQTLSLSGGTTTLSVGGDWTNNGATFSGGAGTVSFTGILKTIDGTSSTDFPIISIANGATITMNNSNTSAGLNFVSLSINSSFTHNGTAALTVNGSVNIGQPTTSVRNNSWIINSGSATVSGLITFAGANVTASRIGRITLTTGTLNANAGITFTASAAATKVIDMSGGAAVLNLKGALTVPALSSTLTAGSSGSIVNYLDSDPQTINFFSAGAYNNLRINNTSAGGASLSGPITTTNLMGNLFVGDTNTGSLFNTGDFNIAMNNSQGLTIYEGSVINAGTAVISPATLATITVNGLFKTANTSGFSGSLSAAINSANSPAIVLGTASTVEYSAGGGAQSVTPLVYNNLTMSNTSGNQTLTGNVTVTKTLSLTTGTMSIGANILTLNGPAIAGTPNSLTGNTTSSLVFGGNSTGITIPSNVSAINNLTINNSNGISLNADLSLTTNLLFSAGKLNTGSNKLILNSGANITGAGQGTGWVNGNLQRNFSNTDPGVFEIGDLNYYSPLTLTFSGLTAAGNILGSSTALEHPNISSSGIKTAKSINRYWTLTNSGVSFSTADISFSWNTADNDAGIIPGNLRLAKYSGSVWTRPAVSGATTSTIMANGVSSLSDFIIGEIANDFSPVITSNGGGASASLSISENGTSVSTISATDADVVTTLSYSLNGGADAAKFSINSSTGVLDFLLAPDFETPADADANNVYVVTVRVSDGSNTADQIISVTILNVNEFSPVISSNGGGATAAISLSENSSSVTTVVATDADTSTPGYSIIGGLDAAKFSINASTGVLSFIVAPDFEAPADADANNTYIVTVRASDGTNNAEQTITTTILNANDNTPIITSNGGGATAALSLSENSSTVTNVLATDADSTTPTYSLSGGADASKFSINSNTGVLSFIAVPDFETPADADANNVYVVTVRASDGANTADQTISLTIINVNEFSPIISSNGGGATAAISLSENSSSVTTVVATDADTTTPTYSLIGGGDAAKFSINSSTGVLSFIAAPDFEAPADADANNTYIVTVRASDGTNNTEQTITTTILNANDNTPIITSNGGGATAALSLSENSSTVTNVVATDADSTTPTYSLSGGADASKFSINSNTGVLSFIAVPDFETPADADANNTYIVTVRASDGTNNVEQTITTTVLNVNDNTPVISSNGGGATAAISLSENSTSVTTVMAADADSTTPTYSLNGGADATKFSINASTGVLSFIADPDFEAPADADVNNTYIVVVRASDGTNSAEQTITIKILNVNDNTPVISSNGGGATAAISLIENSTSVTTVVATDADSTTPTYSLNGGTDAAKFSINSSTGVLSFISAPDFEAPADADANNTYIVIVRASDGTNNADQTISVTISNLNDNKPIISLNQVFELEESSTNNTIVGTVLANDSDAGTSLQNWTIVSGNAGNAFAINSSTGVLSVLTQASLQYDLIQAFNLNLSVSDGLNVSNNQAVKINLKEVARPTIVLGPSPSVCKGITSVSLAYSATTGSPDSYSISWNAAATLAGFNSVTNAGLTSSAINIAVPSQVASSTYSGTIIVKNAFKSSVSYPIDIRVNAVPSLVLGEMPSICRGSLKAEIPFTSLSADPNSYSITWDQPALSAGFVNVDPGTTFPLASFAVNTPANAPAAIYTGTLTIKNSTCTGLAYPIKVTILNLPEIPQISGSKEVYVNKAIQLSASVQGGVWSSSNPAIASVDPVTGLVSGKTNGKATIDYSVKNSNSCSNNSIVEILVSTENSAISLNWIPLQVYGNSTIGTLVGTLSASSNNLGATYSFSLVSGAGSTDNSLFVIFGNEIRITQLFNIVQDKTFSIRVRATDQNGLSEDRVLSVNVIHVNNAPTINAIANMVICSTPTPGVLTLSGISPGPEPGQNVILTVSTDNINLFNTLNVSAVNGSNAVLDYTLKDGLSGIANITLTLTDNGGTDNGGKNTFISTFTMTVNPAVVAIITSAAGVSISKGQTVELIASGGNSYVWANAPGIISGQNTDKLVVRPAQNTSYQVTVTNSFGCTSTQSIALNVIEDFITLQPANIMSPNGDGINDKWEIENIDMYPDNEVRVYDKAGRLIFYKKGYTNTWDATINGNYLAEGTYYYYVDFGFGLRKLKGYITIVKD